MLRRPTRSPAELIADRQRHQEKTTRARVHHDVHTLREAPHHLAPEHRRERGAAARAYLGRHAEKASPEELASKARDAAASRPVELERHADEMASLAREACAAEHVERPEDLSQAGQDALLEHLTAARARHDAAIAPMDAAELAHHETELLASLPPET